MKDRVKSRVWTLVGMNAAALLLVPLLGVDLIPQLAQDRFEMTATLPPGTQLAETDALVQTVAGAGLEPVRPHRGRAPAAAGGGDHGARRGAAVRGAAAPAALSR